MTESNITLSDQSNRVLISHQPVAADRTGLFIGLFLLFLLFVLIFYLLYSFFSYKRFSWRNLRQQTNVNQSNLNKKIELNDSDDLINNENKEIVVIARTSSFSDCGTSMHSSSTRSHPYLYHQQRSSSYKLCSQASNLLTPRVSSYAMTADECLEAKMIIEPSDVQSANALSRSISKYYERKRKPTLRRRARSCEQLMVQDNGPVKRPLKVTASLPGHRSFRRAEKKTPNAISHRLSQPVGSTQASIRRKPTTIYELYRTDRMRIANLLVSNP